MAFPSMAALVPDKRERDLYRMPRRPARLLTAAAALYAVIVCAGSFLHHDFVCQLGPRSHCTSCVLSDSISATTTATPLHIAELSMTGRIACPYHARPDSVDLVKSTGRSPPPA